MNPLSSGFIPNVSERSSPTIGHTLNLTLHLNFVFSPQAGKKKRLFNVICVVSVYENTFCLPNTYIFDSMSMLLGFEHIFCIKK